MKKKKIIIIFALKWIMSKATGTESGANRQTGNGTEQLSYKLCQAAALRLYNYYYYYYCSFVFKHLP